MENREVLQLTSVLLQYPNQEILEAPINEFLKEIKDKELAEKLNDFYSYLTATSLDELTENYVRTFDFNDKTNLYLTYSKLKEERERGAILVKLKGIYEDEGFEMSSDELPDYLPLFLEFLSIASDETIIGLSPQFIVTIKALRNELEEIKSPYAKLIDAALVSIESYTNKEALQ